MNSIKNYKIIWFLWMTVLLTLPTICLAESNLSVTNVLQDSIIKNNHVNSFNDGSVFKKNQWSKKNKIALVTTANVMGYGATLLGLYDAWYKNYTQNKFHIFNDSKDWLQMDKMGHAYSAYTESKASMQLWQWTGMPYQQSVWIGGLSGAAYQTVIEILDGYSSEWGWSWADFTANVFGSGLLISQELLWKEQRIDLKFSFHKNNYSTDAILQERANNFFGTNFLELMLKDYNAQTYWLSVNLKSFFSKSNLPNWLNVAMGYSAEGMFSSNINHWFDNNGNHIKKYDVERYRQWYLSPDINFTKIKTKSKFLKTTFFVLNCFKFPAPTLGYSKKGVEIKWLYF